MVHADDLASARARRVNRGEVIVWVDQEPRGAGIKISSSVYLFDARRLLARREADALLWISTLSDLALPAGLDALSIPPLIVVAGPNAAAAERAEVFFPVATPGIDHGGHLVRTDKVLTMRLAAARASGRASCAQVLRAISEELHRC